MWSQSRRLIQAVSGSEYHHRATPEARAAEAASLAIEVTDLTKHYGAWSPWIRVPTSVRLPSLRSIRVFRLCRGGRSLATLTS